ncbi:hypothetical protein FW774_01920 (plasmid) [Pedobacter sp. BS3]|nr:hypothetical protein FW774_01920 [Pedobacter sp. BS3]
MLNFSAKAQTPDAGRVKPVLFDGVLVAGYADDGAFVNCTGPGVKFNKKPFSLLVGLLPSLKIKEDKVTAGTKNATITPTLGFGLTAVYKHLAIQLPFYYLSKTAAKDGKWIAGAGIGYKF